MSTAKNIIVVYACIVRCSYKNWTPDRVSQQLISFTCIYSNSRQERWREEKRICFFTLQIEISCGHIVVVIVAYTVIALHSFILFVVVVKMCETTNLWEKCLRAKSQIPIQMGQKKVNVTKMCSLPICVYCICIHFFWDFSFLLSSIVGIFLTSLSSYSFYVSVHIVRIHTHSHAHASKSTVCFQWIS